MKTLDVHISSEQLRQILDGECTAVSYPVLPDNFLTCCDMYIGGRRFDRREDALEIPAYAEWLRENDIQLEPVHFDSLRLITSDNAVDSAPLVAISEAGISYIDDADGQPLFTLVNGIYYRKIMMNYTLASV